MPPDSPRTPWPLLVAVAVTGLEALALVVVGVLEVTVITSERAVMGVSTVVFFVVYGAGLGACAWQLGRRRTWARAPVVLAQLIQIPVAWSFHGGSTTAVAVAGVVAALVALAGIFHPASLRVLTPADEV